MKKLLAAAMVAAAFVTIVLASWLLIDYQVGTASGIASILVGLAWSRVAA